MVAQPVQWLPGDGSNRLPPWATRRTASQPAGGLSRTAWRGHEDSTADVVIRRPKSQQRSLRPEVKRSESSLEQAFHLCRTFELAGNSRQEIPYRGIRGMDFWYQRFARPASREQYSREPTGPVSCLGSAADSRSGSNASSGQPMLRPTSSSSLRPTSSSSLRPNTPLRQTTATSPAMLFEPASPASMLRPTTPLQQTAAASTTMLFEPASPAWMQQTTTPTSPLSAPSPTSRGNLLLEPTSPNSFTSPEAWPTSPTATIQPASPSSPTQKPSRAKDSKKRNKEKELSAEKRAIAGRILDVLRNLDFFRDLEVTSPGILSQVAKQSKLAEEVAGQILFRQGDSPVACYVLVSGQVETRVFKAESREGDASPKSPSAATVTSPSAAKPKAPTPRTAYKPRDLFTLTDARSRNQDKAVDKNGKPVRFKTSDGGSTFSAESTLGDQLNVLHPGAISGDGALHHGTGIQTTIRCTADCEFVVIPGETYRRVMKPRMHKHGFLEQHVPGAKVEYEGRRDIHPGCLFKEDDYPEGHGFLFEGINAEPSIFVVGAGSRVDFRRYRCPDENPAYMLASRPLSAPTGEINALSSSKSAPTLQLGGNGLSQSAPAPFSGSFDAFPNSGLFALPHEADPRWHDGEGDAAEDLQTGEMGTYDSLGEGGMFCSLAALPVSACEPFTAVAAGPDCKVYSINGPDLQRLLPNFLRGLRGLLIKEIMRRFNKFLEQHPDAFVPPPPAPQSSMFNVRLDNTKEKKDAARRELLARAAKLEEERRREMARKRQAEKAIKMQAEAKELAQAKKPAWMRAHEKAAERAREDHLIRQAQAAARSKKKRLSIDSDES